MLYQKAKSLVLTTTCTLLLASGPQNTVSAGGGYDAVPSTSMFLGSDGGCDSYDPTIVDWNGVVSDLMDYFSQGGRMGPDGIPRERAASIVLRSAFHDAGAYRGGNGGADGSLMLSRSEQLRESNMSPFMFTPYARAALTPIVQTYGISWADAIAVGGIAGAQFLGAPSGWNLPVGRCDNDFDNPDVLPAGNAEYRAFAQYWNSVGINIRDAAALMGVHSAVDADDGGDPVGWSNSLYIAQHTPGIDVVDQSTFHGPDGVQWSGGVWKYTVNDAHTAPENVLAQCSEAPACPFMSQWLQSIRQFAGSEGAWNSAFKSAYIKMTSIGANWSPMATTVQL